MFSICLLNAYANDARTTLYPSLGLLYLKAALLKIGLSCDIIDANVNNLDYREIAKILCKYSIIGISVNSSSVSYTLNISKYIKSIDSNKCIILGGHYATHMHEELILDYDYFDAVVRGEGDLLFGPMCQDYLNNGKFTVKQEGVSYKNFNEKIVLSEYINHVQSIDSLPFPCREDISLNTQSLEKQLISISSSRGCPYNCIYCSVPKFRSKWIGRSAPSIANEVYEIYKVNKNIRIIYADDNFYVNPDRALKIVNEIEQICGQKIEFAFSTRSDQIVKNGYDNLLYFQKHGCKSIEVGIENGSDSVLQRYKKGTNKKINSLAIKQIRNSKINILIDYIMFDPFTTKSELIENYYFLKENNLLGYYPELLTNRMVQYPGTEFSEISISNDYFVSKETYLIFESLNKFKTLYDHIIQLCLLKINDERINFGTKLNSLATYYKIRLSIYELFYNIITKDNNESYNLFIEESRSQISELYEYFNLNF